MHKYGNLVYNLILFHILKYRFVLSGIVSWGLECGKKDVPGVYADVAQGLCFIDYATKCIHGKKYQQFYDYPQCTNWLVDLLAMYVLIYVTSILEIQI